MRRVFITLLVLSATARGDAPGRPRTAFFQAIRLDDELSRATIRISKTSGATAAEPVVWQNFFHTSDITWRLIRGRIGVRNGDLMVKGEGSTPVIAAPAEPVIDWSLYQAIEIRMSAQAGREIKIKLGAWERRQTLGPPNQYNTYRFELDPDALRGNPALGIMPTDSLTGMIAIHSIRLVPRPAIFAKPYGREFLGKRDEYREAVYVHAPAAISFPVTLPPRAHLRFGVGVMAKNGPVRFHISIEGSSAVLFSKLWSDPDAWEDADVDLSRWSGRAVKLELHAESDHPGAVGLWTNPTITGTAAKAHPNILIYTIDTLRPDHASLYGYARDTTPFLKKFGASGVVFDDCQAQATWTKPSIASLMTSLYSFTHAIVGNSDTIPSGSATLAGQLRSAGYVTASIVGSPFVGRVTGLERGFDFLLESPVIERQHNRQTDRDTDSAALNRVVFPWLEHHHDAPFFLYAHSTDPHAPYGPPPPYDGMFAKSAETAAFNRNYAKFVSDREHGGAAVFSPQICEKAGVNPSRFIHQAIDRYDGEIRHNDQSFELLVAKLKQLGVLDNTLIVVLSDHGEEFWDHGWTGHGQSVYQELTHTLLLMWNPALLPSRRIAEPVQLIDVMPTVLDLAGLKTPSVVEGQSLVPLVRGRAFRRRGLVVSSRLAGTRPVGPVPENATDGFTIIDSKWSFIYRKNTEKAGVKKVELYDRSADRAEKHDVAEQHPQEISRLVAELAQWIAAQNKIRAMVGHTGTSTLDQKTIEQLRSLGYLGGSSQ